MFAPPITKTKTKPAELKRATSVPQRPFQSTVYQVHMLQRTIGNQAMLRLLAQRAETGTAESAGAQAPASVPPSVALDLNKSGQPLDSLTREFMESRFGYDFGKVRVHTGEDAAASTREMGARAYTVGRDVVFGEGRYAPSTNEGKQLLAHELAHVV
jgi:hypothetical protein